MDRGVTASRISRRLCGIVWLERSQRRDIIITVSEPNLY